MNEITSLLLKHAGSVLFLATLVEQIGLPLPAVPWLVGAGALAASGKLNPWMAIGVTFLACMIADSLWFCLGRRRGHRVLALL